MDTGTLALCAIYKLEGGVAHSQQQQKCVCLDLSGGGRLEVEVEVEPVYLTLGVLSLFLLFHLFYINFFYFASLSLFLSLYPLLTHARVRSITLLSFSLMFIAPLYTCIHHHFVQQQQQQQQQTRAT